MWSELKARPLVLLLAGLLLGLTFPAYSWLFCIGVGLGIIFNRPWLSILSAGTFLAGFVVMWRTPPPTLPAGDFQGRVVIHSFPNFNRGKNIYSFESLTGERYSGFVRLDPSILAAPGTILEVSGKANETKTGTFTPKAVRIVSGSWMLDWLVVAQRSAIQRTNTLFGREDGAWVSALTFNFPSDLSSDDKADLRFNGTYHMVSASGMHVFVIALVLHYLLRQLGVRRHWQLLIVFALLLVYCGITGFHAPTLRASLMWLIAASAFLFRRSPDGLSALCLSALVWLFFVPSDASTAGFQLSYIVSGALLLWFERLRFHGFRKRYLVEPTLVAMAASEPLAAWWFGQIIFISPVSNLLIEIPSQAVMILGFLCFLPLVGEILVFLAKPLVWWMKWVTSWTAAVPFVMVNRYSVSPLLLVGYYGVLLWALLGYQPTKLEPFKEDF